MASKGSQASSYILQHLQSAVQLDQVGNFELPKKHVICLFILMLGGYVIATLLDVQFFDWQLEYHGVILYEDCLQYGKDPEQNLCGDYVLRERYLSEWQFDWLYNDFRHGIVLSLLVLSREVFGEPRVLSFISSIVFLVLTFFVGKAVSGKKYVGLIAMMFVMMSSIFNKYDTGITYPTFWGSFYLASILAMFKVPKIAFVPYLLAMCFKNIAVLYFPVSLVFARFSSIDVKSKRIIYITHVLVLVAGLVFLVASPQVLEGVISQINIELDDFVWWLGMWAVEFNDDRAVLFSMFFVIGGLWILKRQNVANSFAVLLVIVVILLQPSFISGFTDFTNEDYRFLVLVAFVGVGIGLVVSKFDRLVYGIQRPSS